MIRTVYGSKRAKVLVPVRRPKKLNKREKTQVKRMITANQEIKYYDLSLIGIPVDHYGVLHDLTPVNQGSTDTDRIGDQLTLRSVAIRGYAQGSSVSTYNVMRMVLFQWKPNSTPAVGDIMNVLANTNAPNSFSKWDLKEQYNVLKDWRILLRGTDYQAQLFYHKISGKKLRKKLQFVAGGNSSNNRVYLLVVTDDGASPYPGITYQSRITYTDA